MFEKLNRIRTDEADKRPGSGIEKAVDRNMGGGERTQEEKVKHLSKGALSILSSEDPKYNELVKTVGGLLRQYGSSEEIPQYEQEAVVEPFGFEPEMAIALAIEIEKATQTYH